MGNTSHSLELVLRLYVTSQTTPIYVFVSHNQSKVLGLLQGTDEYELLQKQCNLSFCLSIKYLCPKLIMSFNVCNMQPHRCPYDKVTFFEVK